MPKACCVGRPEDIDLASRAVFNGAAGRGGSGCVSFRQILKPKHVVILLVDLRQKVDIPVFGRTLKDSKLCRIIDVLMWFICVAVCFKISLCYSTVQYSPPHPWYIPVVHTYSAVYQLIMAPKIIPACPQYSYYGVICTWNVSGEILPSFDWKHRFKLTT